VFQEEQNKIFLKRCIIMANKKTVVQMYEEVLALCETDEQRAFINKRIEITQKKNASKSAEPTPKQKEKMAADEVIENAIVAVMEPTIKYTPTDLLKLVDGVPSTQKLTPRLTALVADGKLNKATVKGASVYSLPVAEVEDTATEN
jgi:hypothetical protein